MLDFSFSFLKDFLWHRHLYLKVERQKIMGVGGGWYAERSTGRDSNRDPLHTWHALLTTRPPAHRYLIFLIFLRLLFHPQVHCTDLSWRLGTAFCPPLIGWPPYTPPSVAPWCRRMETGSGPGRRTRSTRSYLEASKSPRTPRRALHVLKSLGPNGLKRSEILIRIQQTVFLSLFFSFQLSLTDTK